MKIYRVNALLLKYWFITRNSMDRIFDIFYWPIMGLVIFGFTTLYIRKVADFPAIFVFLLGGSILLSVFERIQQDVTVFILEDFWSGNIANSFVTPIKESEISLSVFLIGVIRSLISFVIMFIIALLAYRFNIIQGGLMSLVFVVPLFIFAWGVGVLISGFIFRFGMRIQVFAWGISYLLQPLAAAYYPIETLPVVLQKIAYLFPLVYIFEGFRMAYNGTFSYHHLFWALGLAILYMILGHFVFIRSIKSARKSGLLTKY